MTGILASFHAFSQGKNTYFFDLTWPDNSTTRVTVYEYLDAYDYPSYYSLQADNSIEFNAKQDVTYGYILNPNRPYHNVDTLAFFPAAEEMFLNIQESDDAYYIQAFESGFIRFRNTSDPDIFGKINIYAPHHTACVNEPEPGFCVESIHVPYIEFRSYSFNYSTESTPITLQIVTGMKKEKEAPAIEILPNPVTSSVKINGPADEIYFITGIDGEVLKEGISANTKTDISDLKPGFYFIQAVGSGFAGKFVKN